MVGIIDSFRSGVPSSKQLYSKYSSDGITYKKFKKQFCDIIEIKKYILSMNNEDYLAKKEVHNIFKYLNNLKYNKFSDVKKAINISKNLEEALKNDVPIDLLEIDIKEICEILGEIIGENYNDKLIDTLFSNFCLGK